MSSAGDSELKVKGNDQFEEHRKHPALALVTAQVKVHVSLQETGTLFTTRRGAGTIHSKRIPDSNEAGLRCFGNSSN